MQFSYHMQHGEDPKYLRVLSTAKHFLDYDQGWDTIMALFSCQGGISY